MGKLKVEITRASGKRFRYIIRDINGDALVVLPDRRSFGTEAGALADARRLLEDEASSSYDAGYAKGYDRGMADGLRWKPANRMPWIKWSLAAGAAIIAGVILYWIVFMTG